MTIIHQHREIIVIDAYILFDDQNADLLPSVIRRIKQNKPADYAYRAVLKRAGIKIPKGMTVDHINRNPYDKRLENLRVVTRSVNNLNRKNSIIQPTNNCTALLVIPQPENEELSCKTSTNSEPITSASTGAVNLAAAG